MHGLAAPALALISSPSYMTLAVIGAIAVIVHEARRLLRRGAFSPPASPGRMAAGEWGAAGARAADRETAPRIDTAAGDQDHGPPPMLRPHIARASTAEPRELRPAALRLGPGRPVDGRQVALACLLAAGLAVVVVVAVASVRRATPGVISTGVPDS